MHNNKQLRVQLVLYKVHLWSALSSRIWICLCSLAFLSLFILENSSIIQEWFISFTTSKLNSKNSVNVLLLEYMKAHWECPSTRELFQVPSFHARMLKCPWPYLTTFRDCCIAVKHFVFSVYIAWDKRVVCFHCVMFQMKGSVITCKSKSQRRQWIID